MDFWYFGFLFLGKINFFFILKFCILLIIYLPYRELYSKDQLPIHPCLKLIAASEQILSTYASRHLLTFTKIKEPEVIKI